MEALSKSPPAAATAAAAAAASSAQPSSLATSPPQGAAASAAAAIEVTSTPKVVKQGWLQKRGEHIRNWRPRYFILKVGKNPRFCPKCVNVYSGYKYIHHCIVFYNEFLFA